MKTKLRKFTKQLLHFVISENMQRQLRPLKTC
jgi:hypothetical protein